MRIYRDSTTQPLGQGEQCDVTAQTIHSQLRTQNIGVGREPSSRQQTGTPFNRMCKYPCWGMIMQSEPNTLKKTSWHCMTVALPGWPLKIKTKLEENWELQQLLIRLMGSLWSDGNCWQIACWRWQTKGTASVFLALIRMRPNKNGLRTTIYWVEVMGLGVCGFGATGSRAGTWMRVT